MSVRLQVLMPMGGLGSRFTTAGYSTPKPLIEVDGRPMFMRALESFKNVKDISYAFVIRKEQDDAYQLRDKILHHLPHAKIAILDHDTRGAVETCLVAQEFIEDTVPIAIADCDIYFESREYFDKVEEARVTGKPEGMLLTFPSQDSRYSYAELDERGKVVRTAEKIVISSHAILGGYFFKDGALFKSLATAFMRDELPPELKEYYMSHLFNLLLERRGDIEIAAIDKKYIFGTPDELRGYLKGEQ